MSQETELNNAFLAATMPDFEFQDDVGGSFPMTFEAHERVQI